MIKHMVASDVTNEFVAHKLALSIGVPTTDAILIKIKKRGSCFVEDCAVGIEFAKEFKRVNLDHFVGQDDSPYIEDIMRYLAFRHMICLDDNVQLAYSNGHILSYDYAESFENGDFSYKFMTYTGNGNTAAIHLLQSCGFTKKKRGWMVMLSESEGDVAGNGQTINQFRRSV